jgi:peptide/nickel transport system substrate-binding protein
MKKFFIVSMALVCVFFSFGPVTAAGPVRGGTLVVGVPETPDHLDAHKMQSASIYWLMTGAVYNGLVSADDNYNIVPNLFKSWEQKDGGKIWEFKLEEGVKFHDGSDLTAEIVKWNFERAMDPKTGWTERRDFADVIDRIEAVGKYTVRFHLKYANPIFNIAPLSVTGRSVMMVSKQAVEKMGSKDFDNLPVGTGPFKVTEYIRDDHLTLVRNENYWKKGLPYLDKIVVKFIKDANTRFAALRTGEIQMMYDLPPEMVPMIQKAPGVTYLKSAPCSYVWLCFNMDPEAEKAGATFFKDVRVRQAISLAIDRDELVKLVVPGMGEPAYGGPLPKTHRYYHQIDAIKYDPARAKQLLKEAGYPNLKFTMDTNNSKSRFARALEVMKEQLARIGVEADIQVLDKAASFPRILARPPMFHATLEDLEFCIDPSYMSRYYAYGSPQNYARWNNPEFSKLLSEGMGTADFQKRKKIYDRAQELIVSVDYVRLMLWYGFEDIAYSSKLKGYMFTPYYNHLKWEKAYLEK